MGHSATIQAKCIRSGYDFYVIFSEPLRPHPYPSLPRDACRLAAIPRRAQRA